MCQKKAAPCSTFQQFLVGISVRYSKKLESRGFCAVSTLFNPFVIKKIRFQVLYMVCTDARCENEHNAGNV